MTATRTYAAKRTLHAMLRDHPALAGVQVEYSYPGRTERDCVYLGRARFTQAAAAAEGGLRQETVTVTVYLRVRVPGGTVAEADARVEDLAAVLGGILAGSPWTPSGDDPGQLETYHEITGGQADYTRDDDAATSLLALQVTSSSHFDDFDD